MGTIQVRDDGKRAITYQARVRRAGYPALSKTFPTREAAEQWIEAIEADLGKDAALRAEETARRKIGLSAQVVVAASTEMPLVSGATPFRDIMERYSVLVSPSKKSAKTEITRLGPLMRDKISSHAVGSLTPPIIAQWRDRRLTEVALVLWPVRCTSCRR